MYIYIYNMYVCVNRTHGVTVVTHWKEGALNGTAALKEDSSKTLAKLPACICIHIYIYIHVFLCLYAYVPISYTYGKTRMIYIYIHLVCIHT